MFHEEWCGDCFELCDDATKGDVDEETDDEGEDVRAMMDEVAVCILLGRSSGWGWWRIEIEGMDEKDGEDVADDEDVGRICEAVESEKGKWMVFWEECEETSETWQDSEADELKG